MAGRSRNIDLGPLCGGWGRRLAAVVLGALVFGAVLTFGLLAMTLASGIMVFTGARLWWLNRRGEAGTRKRSGVTLDAEYEVVSPERCDIDRSPRTNG